MIKPKIIFLMGPTAVGKSEFAMQLAKKISIEIISVDSAMIYRGMDIGTGKPTLAERQQVPHHLIDIRDPDEPYSAAEFAVDALQAIVDITRKGKIPLLVGGTFLYFKALQQGLSKLPSKNAVIRERLTQEAAAMGWAALHQRLATFDPIAAKRIHPNDAQRIQRALEVYEISCKPMSDFFDHANEASENSIQNYDIKAFTLLPVDRKALHLKIEGRFMSMLAMGFVAEVEKLYQRGDLTLNHPAMRAVGYRQVWQYLAGVVSYDDMVLKTIAATRQLAKRQLTWLRSLTDNYCLQNSGLASLETVINCLSERGN